MNPIEKLVTDYQDWYYEEMAEHTETLVKVINLSGKIKRYEDLLDRILEECMDDPCYGGLQSIDLINEFRENETDE